MKIGCWNIRVLGTSDKQKKARKYIVEEALSVCEIIETHLKAKSIQRICDFIFGNWEWTSNMQFCDKGCRILLGWNTDTMNVNIIHQSKQSLLCSISTIKGDTRMLCSFVYAANGGCERRVLWKDLGIYRRIVGKEPWAMMDKGINRCEIINFSKNKPICTNMIISSITQF